jgi:cation/acetate symporter
MVGLVSALGLILISPDMWVRYGLLPGDAPISINSPALISIPLSFISLVVVSLLTQKSAVMDDATEIAGA